MGLRTLFALSPVRFCLANSRLTFKSFRNGSKWTPGTSKSFLTTLSSCKLQIKESAYIPGPLVLPSRRLSASPDEDKKVKLEQERIVTIPNLLCVSRIALAPYIAHLIIVQGDFKWALAFFGYAGATDLLDGYIARNFKGQMSMLGSFLDPLADKILVATLFLSLTYVNLIPPALTSLVVSRDALLVFAGFYIRYMGTVPPFTFKKYFDMRLPTAQVQPTQISKVNTLVQLVLVGSALAAPTFGYVDHSLYHGLCILTACTTFASAVSYAFMKDTYRFSHRSYDHQFAKKLTAFILFCGFNAAFVYLMPVRKLRDENESDKE